MLASQRLVRTLFTFLGILCLSLHGASLPHGPLAMRLASGAVLGLLLASLMVGCESLLRRVTLRLFNTLTLGMVAGYLLGLALVALFEGALRVGSLQMLVPAIAQGAIKISLLLLGTFLGVQLTLHAAQEVTLCIPFIRLVPNGHKRRDLICDASVLCDPRLLDLASTGLLDHQLIVPQFVLHELQAQVEGADIAGKSRAKRALEVAKQLETLPALHLQLCAKDFPDAGDVQSKLVQLARASDAHLLTADLDRVQCTSIEGVKIINLHSISNALKPLMPAGQLMKIKIQRCGKEPMQGVGYLDDGTMVVVNGGGDFIGETIDAQVLSVKHTSSGRMIFCNASEEAGYPVSRPS